MAKHLTHSQFLHSSLQCFVSTPKRFWFTGLNSRFWVSVYQGCRTGLGHETCYTTRNCVKVKKKPGLECWSRRYHNQVVFRLDFSPGSQVHVNNLFNQEFRLSRPTLQWLKLPVSLLRVFQECCCYFSGLYLQACTHVSLTSFPVAAKSQWLQNPSLSRKINNFSKEKQSIIHFYCMFGKQLTPSIEQGVFALLSFPLEELQTLQTLVADTSQAMFSNSNNNTLNCEIKTRLRWVLGYKFLRISNYNWLESLTGCNKPQRFFPTFSWKLVLMGKALNSIAHANMCFISATKSSYSFLTLRKNLR